MTLRTYIKHTTGKTLSDTYLHNLAPFTYWVVIIPGLLMRRKDTPFHTFPAKGQVSTLNIKQNKNLQNGGALAVPVFY